MQTNVIITGGSCGIGKEIARVFINSGCRVFNLSRTLCPISGVENYSVDLKDTESLEKSILKIKDDLCAKEKHYKLILVHNACMFIKDSFSNTDEMLFMDSLRVSLLAPAIINKSFISIMSEGSAILYIGSTLSEKAVCNTFFLHYNKTCCVRSYEGYLSRFTCLSWYSYLLYLSWIYRYTDATKTH